MERNGGTLIEVRALTKAFGAQRAVDELSFTAPAGKVTGFLGPNGAGKTTTFRCLLGLAEPTSGDALIGGRPYGDLVSPRRHVGAVLESMGFHPARTGRDHLRVIARAAGLDAAGIDPLLEVVGLRTAVDRRVGAYSLGMRQRLGIAAAMLGDPQVLVLDEPANGLDPGGVSWIRRLLRLWADEGRTVVVSSHLLAEVAQVVDRVVIINEGMLVAETDIAALTADRVTVRVDRADLMQSALRAEGADFEMLAGGVISIEGRTTADIGGIAARAGVTVTELGQMSAGQTLEAMFLAVTGGDRR
ncbi:MAG: ATP-binding cassette domain-containing protein [Actinobacteria bacterium]|nr:ATP-binding cassette domain-containing protein [Actinomycetota bacterium]